MFLFIFRYFMIFLLLMVIVWCSEVTREDEKHMKAQMLKVLNTKKEGRHGDVMAKVNAMITHLCV